MQKSAYVYPEKPTSQSTVDPDEILARAEADPQLRHLLEPFADPTQKYEYNVSSNMSYGWHSKPLVYVPTSP